MSSLAIISSPSTKLISQGAEARVYLVQIQDPPDGPPVLLKHRFRKGYRHPTLDSSLTRHRVAGEAKALLRCTKAGIQVPGVRMVDSKEGVICVEWIDGNSVRRLIPGGEEGEEEDEDLGSAEEDQDELTKLGLAQETLMRMIGAEIAKMHGADVIHGDLTTSNMILRRAPPEIVLIDFGLSFVSNLVEDKAVDLYVLERAFSSTHPDSEKMFAQVLEAYAEQAGREEWRKVGRRLDDVRLRGRKRSMVG